MDKHLKVIPCYDFHSIVVKNRRSQPVQIISDSTPHEFVGKGMQGAVYKLSSEQCVEIYGQIKHRKWEEEILRDADSSPFFPKILDSGDRYIVMEYIKGHCLKNVLVNKEQMPPLVTKQLLNIFDNMKQLDFTNYNPLLRAEEIGEYPYKQVQQTLIGMEWFLPIHFDCAQIQWPETRSFIKPPNGHKK